MATERDYRRPGEGLGGKYRKLRAYLEAHPRREWRSTFGNIESILGFELPVSARKHSAWWANEKNGGRQSQKAAWSAAGWETAEVDLETETLVFRPKKRPRVLTAAILDAEWPGRDFGPWPEGLSLRREDMYEDRI